MQSPPPFAGARRLPVLIAVLAVGALCVGCRSDAADRTSADAPPPAARDPLNPAIHLGGGSFLKGSNDPDGGVPPQSPYSTADEHPLRRATSGGFWMQQHEVTSEEYRRFDPTHAFVPGEERHPATNVTWREAMAYAESLGGTLPTETQWEFAARGPHGRRYPWGNEEPTCTRAHFDACEPRGTIEVMSLPHAATPAGIHDLAGNVWEWVKPDWFNPPVTPVNKASRRLRGGSFVDEPFFLRASNRNNEFYAGFKGEAIGFRVVWPDAKD